MIQHMNFEINVQELASYLQEKRLSNSPLSTQSCIYRVPSVLSSHKEHLFEPNLVSIGPYHRCNLKLQPFEKIKLWYLDRLIARAPTLQTNLECFIQSIGTNAENCYKHYSQELYMSVDEFIEMLIIDGCFIIEFFRRKEGIVTPRADDPFFRMPWTIKAIAYDSLHENALRNYRNPRVIVDSTLQNKHLLDLHRNILLSGLEHTTEGSYEPIPSVTELLQAGIKIEEGEKNKLMKIEFKNGVLRIPQIVILDYAELFFRNLIAYEQCDRNLRDKVTSYFYLLDNLINSSKDVDYLRERGIIVCYLSSEDVYGFFQGLYKNTHAQISLYSDLGREVTDYCQSHWPRWRATLARDYFSNPWSVISVIAAFIALVLTFLQTLYSIRYH
ncbi:UPF0481 protein At3g47200 isoform X2 [Jatropha curcas]|uniref:UPF0481 protein At3g47200 isoform X2 n=1 Tax=Jatropha curcas TaxID=180498 RepID=UPI0005FB1FEC|nr:UPF0481 protein At3g47200 isoform X2 [Jatropha curcas]